MPLSFFQSKLYARFLHKISVRITSAFFSTRFVNYLFKLNTLRLVTKSRTYTFYLYSLCTFPAPKRYQSSMVTFLKSCPVFDTFFEIDNLAPNDRGFSIRFIGQSSFSTTLRKFEEVKIHSTASGKFKL